MWDTEDIAIIFLVSENIKHIIDLKIHPQIPKIINSSLILEVQDITRISPVEPSFNRILAKITEPAVGLSTCAKGNQVCKKNTGSFTIKATTIKTQTKVPVFKPQVSSNMSQDIKDIKKGIEQNTI